MENDVSLKSIASRQRISGYLQKKSTSIFGNWLRRYFILFDNGIQYYEDEKMLFKKGDIFLVKIRNPLPVDELQFSFEYGDRKYLIRAANQEQRNKWLRSILISSQQVREQKNKKKTSKMVDQQKKIKKLNSVKSCYQEVQSFLKEDYRLNQVYSECSQQILYNRMSFLKSQEGIYWLISFKGLQYNDEDNKVFQKQIYPYKLNYLYFRRINSKISQEICSPNQIKEVKSDPSFIHIHFLSKETISIDKECIAMNHSSKFQRTLKKAIIAGKQYYNSQKFVITQNVDALVSNFDQNFATIDSKITKKIKTFLRFKNCINEAKTCQFITSFNSVIEYLEEIKKALIVKSPSRQDIFQYYSRKSHEQVYRFLSDGWKMLHFEIPTQKIRILYESVLKYDNITNKYLKDERILNGLLNLSKILIRQMQEGMKKIIIDNLQRSQLVQHEKLWSNLGNLLIIKRLESQLPKMKLVCKNVKLFSATVNFIKFLYKFYFQKISLFSEKCQNIQLLLGNCNDLTLICDYISVDLKNVLCEQDDDLIKIFEQQCQRQLIHYLLNTKISLIKKFFRISFSSIKDKIINLNLGQIDMLKITLQIQKRITQIDKISNSVRQNIYLTSFDQVCNFYFNCIVKFQNTEQFDSAVIGKKIVHDLSRIKQRYSNLIGQAQIKRNLNDIKILYQVICCENSRILRTVRLAKNIFGNALTNQVLKNLILMRNGTSDFKKKQFQQCLQSLSYQNFKLSPQDQKIKMTRADTLLDTWNQSRSRTNTLCRIDSYCNNEVQLLSLFKNNKQGFLLKKKAMKTMPFIYCKTYFRLQAGKLFQYDSQASQSPKSIFPISEVTACYIKSDEQKIIIIEDKNSFTQLKAQTEEQAEAWMTKILQEMRNGVINSEKKISQEQLFKDYKHSVQSQARSNKKLINSPQKLKKNISLGFNCAKLNSIFSPLEQ